MYLKLDYIIISVNSGTGHGNKDLGTCISVHAAFFVFHCHMDKALFFLFFSSYRGIVIDISFSVVSINLFEMLVPFRKHPTEIRQLLDDSGFDCLQWD